MFDVEFLLTYLAAIPAGVGGALIGARAVDWARELLGQRTGG